MSFDIASATVYHELNEGSFLHLTDPRGVKLYNADKKPVGVTLYGRNSERGIAAARAVGNQRLADRFRGGAPTTIEVNEQNNAEILAACTGPWTWTELDGQPFPHNLDNARRFWNDERFRRWRDQAEEYISSEANFMKG